MGFTLSVRYEQSRGPGELVIGIRDSKHYWPQAFALPLVEMQVRNELRLSLFQMGLGQGENYSRIDDIWRHLMELHGRILSFQVDLLTPISKEVPVG